MKKKIKIFVLPIFIVLFIGLLVSILSFLRVQNEPYTKYTNDIEVSYIVVPGAQISSYGPGYALEDRLYASIQIYRDKPSMIYLSGAYDTLIKKHEVDIMYDYIRQNNIPTSSIQLDYEGISTIETLKNIKEMADNEPIVICTQEMYAPRTMYLAHKLQLHAYVYISDRSIYKYDTFFALVREYLACTKAVLQTIFY